MMQPPPSPRPATADAATALRSTAKALGATLLTLTLLTVTVATALTWTLAPAPAVAAGRDGSAAAATAATADADADDAAAWDVEAPPGEHRELELEVDEGTWMSLDVSPDGTEIVFDLLGDLYTLPIEGGTASALTSGLAWDMQPRYSPDGRWISYTSDRGGGDNVWILDRTGAEAPRQVTDEDFRLLNNAVWSPDGDYLAARKHFTARRSLGAGEIWLYHKAGGSGLQVNERPNDQKDLGEPAFSPDGRYLYFSRDSTPGDVFEYSKDSNDQIYTVHRIDRATGEEEVLIDGPGGAARPTPSPDGRFVAFVRRVRFKTALFLHELDSGRETLLTDELERDMQETWAIHGVYPNLAWTPDSSAIVFWAGGKIRRLELASREVTEIPFRVRQTHRVAEALRFPVEVAPDEVDVRMLRWVQVSPRGDRVVFEALGRLWIRDLAVDGATGEVRVGEARRLTGQDEHFELYPSFSRDGSRVVYVSWHDTQLGRVRVAPAGGTDGAGTVIVDVPGHYVEPVFSPNGVTVVYRKTGGGRLTSPLFSRDQGLYKVAAKGGEPTRLRRGGSRPQFGLRSDRVYFTESREEGKRALVSVGLAGEAGLDATGRDEAVHALSAAATEFRVSHDERWIAFSERFNAYVAPFVPTGKPLELGPETSSIPVRRVSRDSGEHLHWSGDGRSLWWSLGPELFRRDLRDAFAFLEGAPEELPEPVAEGVAIGFQQPADRPQGQIALVGARLVTMRGDEVIEDGTVLVEGDRIVAVGRRDEVEVPAGAHRLDVAGHTVLPGLVDVHWHGGHGTEEIVPQRNWLNYAALAFGVTTVHDPSTDTSTVFAASELARVGAITAPRLFSTGTILYGAETDFKAIIDSLEDARSHLRRMKAVGAFSVKSYNQPRRDQRQQVVAAARELEMLVVPEGGSLFMHNMTMVVDGHTGIEHSLPVARIYDDVRQLWGASEVAYTPTLVVAYGGIFGERYWYQHTPVWENERLLSFVPRPLIDARSRRRMMAPDEEYNHFAVARVAHELSQLGVRVNVGAHGQREGLGAHWEMWMLEQGGMAPHDVLRAATLNGARYLGMDHELGSLETGKLADLIVLAKNPLDNIRDSESVVYTMVGGRLYDAATMDQIGNEPEERGPFFWEDNGAALLGTLP